MTSAATTRTARVAAGKCAVCLKRKATDGHATCPTCRRSLASYAATRYAERRAAGQCVRCGEDAGGAYLCESDAAERRKRRSG